jgi:CBS-domain-containing membrane protein
MRVADIMEPAVRTVTADTPVSEVVVSLADAQITGLLSPMPWRPSAG